MISQMEFVRRVDVQTETIERYVREGKLVPDLIVPMSEHRTFKYFKEETLHGRSITDGMWQSVYIMRLICYRMAQFAEENYEELRRRGFEGSLLWTPFGATQTTKEDTSWCPLLSFMDVFDSIC